MLAAQGMRFPIGKTPREQRCFREGFMDKSGANRAAMNDINAPVSATLTFGVRL